MLWRVRTTPDRPGALAALAQRCGDCGVDILGLQIFPGIGSVTDEMVLRAPADWGGPEITDLLRTSGGLAVVVQPCTEAALADQPARYVQAARTILDRPTAFPEVVARLFDAEPEPADSVLAQAMVHEGLRAVSAGANPMGLKRGMDAAASAVADALRTAARDVDNKEDMAAVATISSRDSYIGELARPPATVTDPSRRQRGR